MGKLDLFLKSNKAAKGNYKYVVSKDFRDEDGNPLEWELRPITTRMHERIEADCTSEVPVQGQPNLTRAKVNSSKLVAKTIATAVVSPNLNSVELQDSYGVNSAEELVREMIDNYDEYIALFRYINTVNGLDEKISDKVETVKN
jgi:hypothetical protein